MRLKSQNDRRDALSSTEDVINEQDSWILSEIRDVVGVIDVVILEDVLECEGSGLPRSRSFAG